MEKELRNAQKSVAPIRDKAILMCWEHVLRVLSDAKTHESRRDKFALKICPGDLSKVDISQTGQKIIQIIKHGTNQNSNRPEALAGELHRHNGAQSGNGVGLGDGQVDVPDSKDSGTIGEVPG